MAGAPQYKIYYGGNYLAACKDIYDALAIASVRGEGCQIRDGHNASRVIWTEGVDGNSYESYDVAAVTATEAEQQLNIDDDVSDWLDRR
jgi:hypothetical protein